MGDVYESFFRDMKKLNDQIKEQNKQLNKISSMTRGVLDYSQVQVLQRNSPQDTLTTSDVSMVSHTHGRQRRAERGIERRELQEAVRYGRREPASRGRDGKDRWRFTHKGVVYVTDASCRHEVTSWRIDDDGAQPVDAGGVAPNVEDAVPAGAIHVVLVVDHSGSMRKDDVSGYKTRTAAVYECLAQQFVDPQLGQKEGGLGGAVVTLVEMSDKARVVFQRRPLDQALRKVMSTRGKLRARSHGNYLQALSTVEEVLAPDRGGTAPVMLMFLSDGAPSDHLGLECVHGVRVWEESECGTVLSSGKQKLKSCPHGKYQCRRALANFVVEECKRRVRRLGDLYGRDRLVVHTVAFGKPDENYSVLEQMAAVVPRGSFQKLGLAVNSLRSAFSSVSSTLTTLRTETGGGSTKTLRSNIMRESKGERRSAADDDQQMCGAAGWHIYLSTRFHFPDLPDTGIWMKSKQRYNLKESKLEDVPLLPGSHGVAVYEKFFEQGAQRLAFRCSEVKYVGFSPQLGVLVSPFGPPLVSKETKYTEQLQDAKFHRDMAVLLQHADRFAVAFNSRPGVRDIAEWQVRFVGAHIFEVSDPAYEQGKAWILTEPELDGRFTKWNNNAGSVRTTESRGSASAPRWHGGGALGTVLEEDEEDEEEGEEEAVTVDEVPQAFSHFTWSASDGEKLVVDLQGVWNSTDGFTLTDPAIHYRRGRHHGGGTDKGEEGIRNFFATHRCNGLCHLLGLKQFSGANEFFLDSFY